MMPDISTRINALIAYLFLGPIILLARAGTPLSHPYVRGHAKKASLYILFWIIAFIIYRLLYSFLNISLFGITLNSIVLTVIVSCTLLILIKWAYTAYQWIPANESDWKSFGMPENSTYEWTYSEEDKIRIIASFIPFISSIITHKYPRYETILGNKISNFSAFIILTSIVFFSGATTTLILILSLLYIGLIVATTVQLFGFSKFLRFSFYDKIPSYLEFDAHVKSSIIRAFDFFRIAFGGQSRSAYQEIYRTTLEKNMLTKAYTNQYFMPAWLIAIPGINIISLPSLWQSEYKEYKLYILQWLLLTILAVWVIWFYGINSQVGVYLLFPIIALAIQWKNNALVRAPITSIVVDIYFLFTSSKEKMDAVKEKWEEKVTYTYEVTNEK